MRIHPVVSYTAGRLGLMVGVAVLLFAVGFRSWALVILSLAISMPASWFLLRNQRDQLATRIIEYQERRRAERAAMDDELDRVLEAEQAGETTQAEILQDSGRGEV
ncbi:MAG TPA: DUF4229 domain-containing protein, partial [Mycobacteriales bacterium]|nr:DUF4229 domain-containing protein [Mycobacteriales bacterium]